MPPRRTAVQRSGLSMQVNKPSICCLSRPSAVSVTARTPGSSSTQRIQCCQAARTIYRLEYRGHRHRHRYDSPRGAPRPNRTTSATHSSPRARGGVNCQIARYPPSPWRSALDGIAGRSGRTYAATPVTGTCLLSSYEQAVTHAARTYIYRPCVRTRFPDITYRPGPRTQHHTAPRTRGPEWPSVQVRSVDGRRQTTPANLPTHIWAPLSLFRPQKRASLLWPRWPYSRSGTAASSGSNARRWLERRRGPLAVALGTVDLSTYSVSRWEEAQEGAGLGF
ncbi:hypothetical protein C8T65DRAFT_64419 [Cerioporus squamosus]|nr:hypothetical protein C8T65DRAFT_64419 [Cerioporus squamosus]